MEFHSLNWQRTILLCVRLNDFSRWHERRKLFPLNFMIGCACTHHSNIHLDKMTCKQECWKYKKKWRRRKKKEKNRREEISFGDDERSVNDWLEFFDNVMAMSTPKRQTTILTMQQRVATHHTNTHNIMLGHERAIIVIITMVAMIILCAIKMIYMILSRWPFCNVRNAHRKWLSWPLLRRSHSSHAGIRFEETPKRNERKKQFE